VLAGALASRLLAGLSGPADHRSLAEGVEGRDDHGAKPSAVGYQEGHGGYTPRNSQHGEKTPQWLTAERGPSLDEDFAKHFLTSSCQLSAISYQLPAFNF
jgi:hypothetical protein